MYTYPHWIVGGDFRIAELACRAGDDRCLGSDESKARQGSESDR